MKRVALPRLVAPVVIALLLVIAGCTSQFGGDETSTSPASPPSPSRPFPAPTPSPTTSARPTPTGSDAQDWPTYHRTLDRVGASADLPAVHQLSAAWIADLDGAVYGQPIVVGGLVVAATEGDTVYGLDRTTGER